MRYISILLLTFVLASCGDEEKVLPSLIGSGLSDQEPSQISFNTEMQFTNEGKMRAVLHAGRIRNYEIHRYVLLDSGVRVDFFNREGIHSSVLTARRARINDMSKNMTAYENVHIVSDSGTIVDTDSLEWLNALQTLHSDAFVKIQEVNGRTTSGHGFQSDQSLTTYSISRPTITAPEGVLNGSTTQRPRQPAVPGPSGFPGSSPGFGIPPSPTFNADSNTK